VDEFIVELIDMQPEVLEHVRKALPEGDPYHQIIEDHRAELRAHHHPVTFVAKRTEPLGYAILSRISNTNEAMLDIVVPPSNDERSIASALLERTLQETTAKVSWWARAPRLLGATELAQTFGGEAQRIVLRMERPLGEPVDDLVQTRGFQDGDGAEIVRINNEAFAGHPDRSRLSEDDIHEQLRVFGNRFDDLRITEGGFCWSKRRSSEESELYVLAIDNAHRGHSLGGRLLRSTLEYVRTEHRVRTASLYVEHDNVKAIALYENNGFVDTGKSLHSFVFPER
jgi:mycothiol synthase